MTPIKRVVRTERFLARQHHFLHHLADDDPVAVFRPVHVVQIRQRMDAILG